MARLNSKHLAMKKTYFFVLLLFNASFIFSQSVATYDITFQSTWNASEHTSIPNNAHWSNLVGATHNTANEFVQLGQNATHGIQDVAELGNNAAFEDEVNMAINQNKADKWLQMGFSPNIAQAVTTLADIEISEDFPFLTLVSMVAPSPDWFIAVNSLNLRNDADNDWKDTFTIDVFAYDAGTDDGSNYDSANNANTPVPVSMINGFPINGNKMGTLTLTLKSVLSIETPDFSNNVKIYPNPSNGVVTIKNNTAAKLSTISIYDILGNQVQYMPLKTNANNTIDLTNLTKGIYLARLESVDGQVKTQKLIIK